MKSFKIIFGACLFLFGLYSCDKAIQNFGDVEFMGADDAIVKINMASIYPDDRYMYVKFDGQRVTPLIRGREPFPGGGYNTRGDSRPDFLKWKSGSVNVQVGLPYKTDSGLDSIILYESTVKFEAGKRYTLHVTDTAKNTKMILNEEDLTRPDSTQARYRFTNLMPNVEAIDLYYGAAAATTEPTQDSLVAKNVKYLETSPYFELNRITARTWKIRKAGAPITNASVLASYSNAGAILDRRSYTVYALGYDGFTSTIMKPYVSFFLIR
ncbi:DUF4397 domain-containing protein [Sphingobacterium sp. BIGb0116]|uniref:DUF4397 domain-containing protein n=1 Tax=Sphingobacterium sp. BIGb0116 TaxID=2940619 RepID=UPI002169C5DE|nr:DUF4397 domain-containing protein [Sphingobacterium sp. BIGb0116]MCS4166597.1 hypothetical protein [Sphingobacterium sp. BIGb0116]